MKKFSSIVVCLLISLSLSAYSEKNTNGVGGGTTYGENSTEAKELDSNEEVESVETSEELDSEPDSSYYSVNKFNFLFYFVYKMKYMDEETEIEKTDN